MPVLRAVDSPAFETTVKFVVLISIHVSAAAAPRASPATTARHTSPLRIQDLPRSGL